MSESLASRWAIPLSLLGMFALIYAIIGDAACQDPPPPPVAKAKDAGQKAPRRAVVMPSDTDPDFGLPKDESKLTLADVERLGLLGREARWVEAMMAARSDWKSAPEDGGPTYTLDAQNIKLTFILDGRRKRVLGAKADFGGVTYSAHLTLLSTFFVGNSDALDTHGLHWETMEPDPKPRQGEFEDALGRKWAYRGTMRTTGESPYGPESFEIGKPGSL